MKLSVLSGVRTNNFNDPEVGNKIGGAWGQALAQKESLTGNIYAVYNNYEGDFTHDYNLSICVEGELEGKVIIEIPSDVKYEVFVVEPSETGVIDTWSKIWELEKSGQLNRAYLNDFESHTKLGEVKIHISVT